MPCPPGLSRLIWDGDPALGTHAHGAGYGDSWEECGPFRRACKESPAPKVARPDFHPAEVA